MLATRLAVPLALCLVLGAVTAQDSHEGKARPRPRPAAHEQKPDAVTYSVVRQGDALKVMSSTELEAARKEARSSYEAALKSWQEAKKAAEADHKAFDQPEPREESMTVVASGLKSSAEAKAKMAKLESDQKKPAHERTPPHRTGGGHDKPHRDHGGA